MSSNSLDAEVVFDPALVLDDAIRAGRTLLSTFFPFARCRNELSAMSRRRLEEDASAFAGDPCLTDVKLAVERWELGRTLLVPVEGTTGTANSAWGTAIADALLDPGWKTTKELVPSPVLPG